MTETMDMRDTVLSVRGLRIVADDADDAGGGAGDADSPRALVDGLSFEVARGACLGLVGESGSGKSLTLRTIMDECLGSGRGRGAGMLPRGVRRAGGGVALADGVNAAMVLQDPVASLDPLMPVVRQVAEVLRHARGLRRHEARREALALLGRLGLPAEDLAAHDRYPGQLSGGQCQRVVLAVALATEPDLLLCDEPTTALDVTVQAQILDLLAGLKARLGLTMVFVTHNLGVAARLCDRLVVMRHGRAIETGATGDVLTCPQEDYTRRLIAAVTPIPGPVPAEEPEGE